MKRIAPFIAIGVAGTWVSTLLPGTSDSELLAVTSALTALLVVGVLSAPWNRLPLWTQAITPLLFLGIIALTRHATGGATSGLGSLVLLPIIWFALYGTRTQLALGVVAVGAVFLAPVIAIGGDTYPAQEWVRGGMWALIAAIVGFTMQELVSNQRRQAEQLRERARELGASNELFEGTLRAATAYSIIGGDATGLITIFNSGAERLLGYSAEEVIGKERPSIFHDPDEVTARAEELGIEPGYEVFVTKARSGETELRRWTYLHRDGTRIPVELTVSATRDADGEVNGFIGIASDISERLEAETALRASESALQAVSEVSRQIANSPDARQSICDAAMKVCGSDIAVLMEPDGKNNLTMTASAGVELPAISVDLRKEPSGSGVAFVTGERLFVPDTRGNTTVSARVNNALSARSVLCEPVRRNGETVAVLTIGWRELTPALSPRVEIAARLLASDAGVAIDRGDLLARLEDDALTDALTGLANRRAWDEQLPEVVRLAQRSAGRGPAVALFDLDHFKSYNDSKGHQAGDRLLIEVSAAWRDQLREGDILARYGGEEFALLIPDCTRNDARQVVERIRSATCGITCSAGLAMIRPGETGDEAVARADAALYEAKDRGRDIVVEAAETASRASGSTILRA